VVNLRELDDSGVVNHLVHCLEKGTFSQARIAKLTGVSTAFISQLKAGKKTLSPRMREKLLQILQPNTNVVHLDDHRNQ
jgi:predicted XRE-type DNA-binding protein